MTSKASSLLGLAACSLKSASMLMIPRHLSKIKDNHSCFLSEFRSLNAVLGLN